MYRKPLQLVETFSKRASSVMLLGMVGCNSITGAAVEHDSGQVACACQHGQCNAQLTCDCVTGWRGERCDECAAGFSGPDCAPCDGGACCSEGDASCTSNPENDGELTVFYQEHDLALINHEGRSCQDGGDAVAYNVVSFSSSQQASLDVAPSAGCLAPGDEVLLINLQGASDASDNVGNYELLRIAGVSGNEVTFGKAKERAYGGAAGSDEGLGVEPGTQRVVLQRVPNYERVVVSSGATLTNAAWDGRRGGVLALRIEGSLDIAGSISMVGRGYRSVPTLLQAGASGAPGEGHLGQAAVQRVPNQGGGGGGSGDNGSNCGNTSGTGGGGAGHALPGSPGEHACAGLGGFAYGNDTGAQLFLGAAGGSGGLDGVTADNPPPGLGGTGGGIILIMAKRISVRGPLLASGTNGEGDSVLSCDDICQASQCTNTDSCYDFTGPGGGGAGGTIALHGEVLELGQQLVQAGGGKGGAGNFFDTGQSGDAGNGSVGRVFTWGSVTGTSNPPDTHGSQ
jgi:hypothetical protein